MRTCSGTSSARAQPTAKPNATSAHATRLIIRRSPSRMTLDRRTTGPILTRDDNKGRILPSPRCFASQAELVAALISEEDGPRGREALEEVADRALLVGPRINVDRVN